MQLFKKITVITGHYGAGKTNFAVNLALRLRRTGERVTIVDLDIVNPYFRTADFSQMFEEEGIDLAASIYANSSLDIPAITFDLERMVYEPGYVVIDVGGDDAGAMALGRYAAGLQDYVEEDLDFLYVINRYRYLTRAPEEALSLLWDIENAARMRATGIVNNSNLGRETNEQIVLDSLDYADAVAQAAGLPLAATCYAEHLSLPANAVLAPFPVSIFVKPIWEKL